MRRSRSVLAGMLVLVLVALAVPAASLAGGSAGDQQYTDPFAGGSGGSGSHTATTTRSSPAPAQTSTSAAPTTTPAAATTSADPTTAAAVSTTAGEPTATIASGPSTQLPHTGYDAWTAVGFGLTLVLGGAALRWHVRTRST